MSKFAINKDFDHAQADIGDTGNTLEIVKLGDDDYGVFWHPKDFGASYEYTTLSLDELKAIYRILSK